MAASSVVSTTDALAPDQRVAPSLEQQIAALTREVERLSGAVAALEQQCVRQSATGAVTLPTPHKLDLSVAGLHLKMEGTCLTLVSPMTIRIDAADLQVNTAKVSVTGQTASFAGTVVCNVLQASTVKQAAGNIW